MKKSELRSIIKHEIRRLVTEDSQMDYHDEKYKASIRNAISKLGVQTGKKRNMTALKPITISLVSGSGMFSKPQPPLKMNKGDVYSISVRSDGFVFVDGKRGEFHVLELEKLVKSNSVSLE